MKILYRISDGSYKKERFSNATKEHCIENFLQQFPKEEVTKEVNDFIEMFAEDNERFDSDRFHEECYKNLNK